MHNIHTPIEQLVNHSILYSVTMYFGWIYFGNMDFYRFNRVVIAYLRIIIVCWVGVSLECAVLKNWKTYIFSRSLYLLCESIAASSIWKIKYEVHVWDANKAWGCIAQVRQCFKWFMKLSSHVL